MYQLLDGRVSMNSLSAVELEDLLRREPTTTHLDDVKFFAEAGKKVVGHLMDFKKKQGHEMAARG
jgi:FlaA1/EpsC-like NDP-sugar epimerase